MRNPNGYGSVYKLSGKRRRPYAVKKTIGYDENGRQIFKIVGYYESKPKAIAALAEYNKRPVGPKANITFGELYEDWKKSKFDKVAYKTRENYKCAWNRLSVLKDLKAVDVRTSHIQEIVDEQIKEGKSYATLVQLRIVAGMMLDLAMADDIVYKNYARQVKLPKKPKPKKEPFNELEIKKIEELAKTDEWINTIYIMIYTGFRIGEVMDLTKFNIDFDEQLIRGGNKTDAGKDRIVPIHPKIMPYIKYWYNKDSDCEYLICRKGKKISPNYYRDNIYYKALTRAEVRPMSPHTTRHTFATLMNRAGADTVALQRIIGHQDYSTTANVYTHLSTEDLKKAINQM